MPPPAAHRERHPRTPSASPVGSPVPPCSASATAWSVNVSLVIGFGWQPGSIPTIVRITGIAGAIAGGCGPGGRRVDQHHRAQRAGPARGCRRAATATRRSASLSRMRQINVLGTELQPCSFEPLTGFYRTGCCENRGDDPGLHVVCCVLTDEFLEFSRLRRQRPQHADAAYGFPGLVGIVVVPVRRPLAEAFEAGARPGPPGGDARVGAGVLLAGRSPRPRRLNRSGLRRRGTSRPPPVRSCRP